MTTARLFRASAACAGFVKRSAPTARVVRIGLITATLSTLSLHANSVSAPQAPDGFKEYRDVLKTWPESNWITYCTFPGAPNGASDAYRLRLSVRPEPAELLAVQRRPRGFLLRELVESSLPPVGTVRLTDEESREGWDWAGIRRQLVRALAGARKIRFEQDAICAESDRHNEPGRIPGVVQDAAIAAGVRARVAGDLGLRGIPLEVQCREGCVRLRGQCSRSFETARAIVLALSVEGVREVRADLPADLAREMAANR